MFDDKYNLKRFINKFDGRYNAEFLIEAKDKNNLYIQNATLDGAIQGNKNTFSREKFRSLKATYYRSALDLIDIYRNDAVMNGLKFDSHTAEIGRANV